MLLGRNPYRFFYFAGRIASFSLAGMIAGEAGEVLNLFLKSYHISEMASLLCGMAMVGWGIQTICVKKKVHSNKASPLNAFQKWSATLLLKQSAWPAFLFGFLTIALPCGQTLVVFSACALVGNAWVGLGNGFAFALLTTPSLVLSMHSLQFFKKFKHYDRAIIGGCAILVGILACCRGMAEFGWIDHLILNPQASHFYHLILY